MKQPHRISPVVCLAAAAVLATCGDDGTGGVSIADTTAACGVKLDQVALYQGVKVVLASAAAGSAPQQAPAIAGRPAVLRAFVTPPPDAAPVELRARLDIAGGGQTRSYEAFQVITGPASDSDLDSTLNFPLSGEDLTPDAALSLAIESPACAGANAIRFPQTGRLPLAPLEAGVLKVRVVPIRYDADGSGRLPDVSPAQLARLENTLRAVLPVAGVQLQVREPIASAIAISPRGGWSELLEQLRELRARDAPPPEVYDYGLVVPARSYDAYCNAACITGLAYVVQGDGPGAVRIRVGVGLGYTGLSSAEVMAHELGHLHGRGHAPCGASTDADGRYPYDGGQIGSWGLDAVASQALRPPTSKDLMSYCQPRWISDYTFAAIARRAAAVNAPVAAHIVHTGPPPRWRVLLVGGAAGPRWSLPATGDAPGLPVVADALDASGASAGQVTVWQVPLGDGDQRALWIPDDGAAVAALRLPGEPALPLPR